MKLGKQYEFKGAIHLPMNILLNRVASTRIYRVLPIKYDGGNANRNYFGLASINIITPYRKNGKLKEITMSLCLDALIKMDNG